jgi:UPF0716 protein FxsA
MGLLVLLFLVIPLLEIYVIIQVGRELGALNTIGLLLLISVVGAWLVKHEGLGVWRRVNAQMAAGNVPGGDILDGFLILLAGALLLTPGFITDAAGLLALFPPTRAVFRRSLRRRFASKVEIYRGSASPSDPPDIDI